MIRNKIIIFTGPSGVGKATVEKELFKDESLKLNLSISATTRQPRKNEIDGKDYYFISNEEFNTKIKNNEFIEYNEHFLNKYGTLKSEIQRIFNKCMNPFLEIEIIGAKQIINKFDKKDFISFFLAPPSIDKLKQRIITRGSETQNEIQQRLDRAQTEINQSHMFDYVVYNDVLEHTIEQVKNIIKKELKYAKSY